jgi:hypothetical protein
MVIKGMQDLPMYFGTTAEIMKIAGDLRNSTTKAKKILYLKRYNLLCSIIKDEVIENHFCTPLTNWGEVGRGAEIPDPRLLIKY